MARASRKRSKKLSSASFSCFLEGEGEEGESFRNSSARRCAPLTASAASCGEEPQRAATWARAARARKAERSFLPLSLAVPPPSLSSSSSSSSSLCLAAASRACATASGAAADARAQCGAAAPQAAAGPEDKEEEEAEVEGAPSDAAAAAAAAVEESAAAQARCSFPMSSLPPPAPLAHFVAADAKRAAATREEVASGRDVEEEEEEEEEDETEEGEEANASRIRRSLATAAGGPSWVFSGITPEGLALMSPGSLMASFSYSSRRLAASSLPQVIWLMKWEREREREEEVEFLVPSIAL